MPWAKGEDFIDLKERFRELQIEEKQTITALHIPKSDLIQLLKTIKEEKGFKLFIDHSVIDFPDKSQGSRPFTYSTMWMKGKE
jgi:NADH-quinone oxidoreductase subunit C/D